MLFMVVEHFDKRGLEPVAERFRLQGRMLPRGVVYLASWMEHTGTRCYQLMEAPDRAALDRWIANWSDLVRFEVTEIMTSADFWATRSHAWLPASNATTNAGSSRPSTPPSAQPAPQTAPSTPHGC